MNRKYVITFALGFIAILGWNVFLIQRDQRLYDAYYRRHDDEQAADAYYRQQAIENLKRPPSNRIDYNPKEEYCASLKVWHPDCKVE